MDPFIKIAVLDFLGSKKLKLKCNTFPKYLHVKEKNGTITVYKRCRLPSHSQGFVEQQNYENAYSIGGDFERYNEEAISCGPDCGNVPAA